MNQTKLFRIAAFVSTCIALTAVGVQAQRLQQVREQYSEAKAELRRAETALAAAELNGSMAGLSATVPAEPGEETAFLKLLRDKAKRHSIQLIRWNSQIIPTQQVGEESELLTDEERRMAELLEGTERIACEVTVAGPYLRVRRFVEEISRAPRLYTLGSVRWSRQGPNRTELIVTISRYVQREPEGALPEGTQP